MLKCRVKKQKNITMKKVYISIITLIIFGINCSAVTYIGPWNITQLKRTPSYTVVDDYAEDGMTSILYESIDYLDNKVEVFAYYSAPSGTMPSGGWPAVVYVHGGSGTALPSWVEYWNDRGYACISMDHHGHYPDGTDTPNPGPDKVGNWSYTDLDFDYQWYYHAVAQVIRATSLIRSFDEVNEDQVGIMGTSWGGTITATVMGLDSRLKFAMPVYGGGYLSDSDGIQGDALSDPDVAAYVNEYYDGSAYFSNVDIPTFWMNGTNDTNFPMTVTSQSSSDVPDPTLCYILRLKHNNVYVQKYEEFAAFADQVIYGADALPEIGTVSISDGTASVDFTSSVGLSSARMMYTTSGDDVAWIDKDWVSVTATISGGTISRAVPTDATVLCFTATDSRDYTISSDYVLTDASTNLALSGTATQSSTLYDAEASLAIDGNTDGVWANGSVTHTDAEDNAWWSVDLDNEYSIDSIVIYNRTDECCMDRLSDFNVFMWDSTGTRTLKKSITSYPDPSVTIDAGEVLGMSIMIKSNLTSTALNLAEVEVYGSTSTLKSAKLEVVNQISDADGSFELYPNPVIDKLIIEMCDAQEATYIIVNYLGQIVSSGVISESETSVDLSGFGSGIYIIQLNCQNRTYSKKIIKN
jgi:dienelactone hydrolase